MPGFDMYVSGKSGLLDGLFGRLFDFPRHIITHIQGFKSYSTAPSRKGTTEHQQRQEGKKVSERDTGSVLV